LVLKVGNVEIREPIAIDVGPGCARTFAIVVDEAATRDPVERAVTVVMVKKVAEGAGPAAGHEQIQVAVVVVIRPGAPLIVAGVGDNAAGTRHQAERAVTVVVIEEMLLRRGAILITADKQIQKAVIIVIPPCTAGEAAEICGNDAVRDFGKSSVAKVMI